MGSVLLVVIIVVIIIAVVVWKLRKSKRGASEFEKESKELGKI